MYKVNNGKRKVLLIMEQCNPEWPSVPLVGYNFFREIAQKADVTLVTHERNQAALDQKKEHQNIFYMPESTVTKKYYKGIARLAMSGRMNWPLYHALSYPIYAEFNDNVYRTFKPKILKGEYDLVHAMTPIMPRYPYKIAKLCQDIPFLLGPVNGGLPFPPGFQKTAKKENANLNFLRSVGRTIIPGYTATYKRSTRILSGSTYTLRLLQKLFNLTENQVSLFHENGIPNHFILDTPKPQKEEGIINLLFVGRLVPYKSADIVIEALSLLPPSIRDQVRLTIVGDGSERGILEQLVQDLNLSNCVNFVGWVEQEETINYYRKADVFCFPSIREFGGAVVIEALANGLPCIVVNYGGIGEYVTEKTGFKIEPISRDYLLQEVTDKIQILVEDKHLRKTMSDHAIERAKEFTWDSKAQKIVEIYEELLESQSQKTGQNEMFDWNAA